MAKCPKCDRAITFVNFKPMESRQSFGSKVVLSIAHTCPLCSSVLSVQVDPVALKTDTLNAIAKLLGKTA
jgi:hypothetical protein